MRLRWIAAAGLAVAAAGQAAAQYPAWPPPEYIQAIPEELKATTHALDTTGEPKVFMPSGCHTAERAGYPPGLRKHLQATNAPRYCGGWVGGGAGSPKRGDGPSYGDGTWGWDVVGHRHYQKVFLNFFHDRPKQPKGGTYEPNEPTVPDIFAYRPLVQIREKKKEASGEGEE